jgi:hypothetical protein
LWPFGLPASTNLECHLCSEDEFIGLEETSGGVHEDAVGDAVRQVVDADPHVIGRGGPLDGHVEDDAEGLQGELERGILHFFRLDSLCNKLNIFSVVKTY